MLLRGVAGRGPRQSALMAMPGPAGRGIEMKGQRTPSREVVRVWHFKQL